MASFWGELRRRNVFRVGVAYLAAVWVLIQVTDVVVPNVGAPTWLIQALIFSSALGFPLALLLAWFYELTPQGIKATDELEAVEAVKFTGRKLDFAIIGLLVLAVGFLVVDDFVLPERARSIAVLPFSNRSAAEENAEFFSTGMHDALLTQLAKLGDIKVISRTSVLEYADSPKNMRQIGEELGVATILEGSVLRSGDTLQINVQLIDAQTDEHLWAELYERELTTQNIFAIQRRMATSIAEALRATLSSEEVSRLEEIPTQSTRAYEFYLSAREYSSRNEGLDDFVYAVEQYKNAIEADPEFALAWTGLARAYAQLYRDGGDRFESSLALAREAVDEAFQLAPGLPEAHLAMGYYHYHGFNDFESALEEWAIAEQGMPGDSDLFAARGRVYRRMGETELAAEYIDRAVDLDPRNLDLLVSQEVFYESLRDYTRAEQVLDRMLEVAPDYFFVPFKRPHIQLFRGDAISVEAAREAARDPRVQTVWAWRALIYGRNYDVALEVLDDWETEVYVSRRRHEYRPIDTYYAVTYRLAGMPELAVPRLRAARATIERQLEISPEDPVLLVALGEVLAELGESDSATDLARRAMELLPSSIAIELRPDIHLNAIMLFVAAGDYASAIKELDAYLSAPGQWSIEGLLPDPRLDPIRDDPRFQAVAENHRRQ